MKLRRITVRRLKKKQKLELEQKAKLAAVMALAKKT